MLLDARRPQSPFPPRRGLPRPDSPAPRAPTPAPTFFKASNSVDCRSAACPSSHSCRHRSHMPSLAAARAPRKRACGCGMQHPFPTPEHSPNLATAVGIEAANASHQPRVGVRSLKPRQDWCGCLSCGARPRGWRRKRVRQGGLGPAPALCPPTARLFSGSALPTLPLASGTGRNG